MYPKVQKQEILASLGKKAKAVFTKGYIEEFKLLFFRKYMKEKKV